MRKIINIPVICLGCLLLILYLLFTPYTHSSALAVIEKDLSGPNEKGQTVKYATFSISDPVTMDSLTGKPIGANDAVGRGITIYQTRKVELEGSKINDFTITMTMDGVNLTSEDSTVEVTPVTTSTSGENIGKNQWGFYYGDNTAADAEYSTINTTQQLDFGSQSTGDVIKGVVENYSKNLIFAAKFGEDIEDDAAYESARIYVNVAITPRNISTISDIEYMQDMYTYNTNSEADALKGISSICEESEIGEVNENVVDIRDNSNYSIRKHEDDNCWMTSNLRFIGDEVLNQTTSDVGSNNGFAVVSSCSGFDNFDISNACYSNNNATYGVHYSWYTATAGTGKRTTPIDTEAESSVCPRGWRLPARTDFQTLVSELDVTSDATGSSILRKDEYRFNFPGFRHSNTINNVGDSGWYWSRTVADRSVGADNANTLYIGISTVTPTNANRKAYGMTVRCIAYSSN